MKVTKVYTIIQLYAGRADNDSDIWMDCVWSSLKEAREHYPQEIYRKVTALSPAIEEAQTYDATSESCMLKKGKQ